jgi:hypothetical protein
MDTSHKEQGLKQKSGATMRIWIPTVSFICWSCSQFWILVGHVTNLFWIKDTNNLNDSYTIHPALYPEFWTQQTKITFLVILIGHRISDMFFLIYHHFPCDKTWLVLTNSVLHSPVTSSPRDKLSSLGQVARARLEISGDGRDFSDPKRGQATGRISGILVY